MDPSNMGNPVLICHEKVWWFGVHNNHRSIYVCSGLRAQLRIRPRPCPISGVRAKIIIILLFAIGHSVLKMGYIGPHDVDHMERAIRPIFDI